MASYPALMEEKNETIELWVVLDVNYPS